MSLMTNQFISHSCESSVSPRSSPISLTDDDGDNRGIGPKSFRAGAEVCLGSGLSQGAGAGAASTCVLA